MLNPPATPVTPSLYVALREASCRLIISNVTHVIRGGGRGDRFLSITLPISLLNVEGKLLFLFKASKVSMYLMENRANGAKGFGKVGEWGMLRLVH